MNITESKGQLSVVILAQLMIYNWLVTFSNYDEQVYAAFFVEL